MVNTLNEKLLKSYIVIFYKGVNQTYIRRSMADKRKSLSKHPYQCRRSRRSTPDLLSPYLPGPELILPPPMSIVQTIPVYSTFRSCGNLNSASPFITGCSSFADSMAPFDSSLVSSNFGPLHTKSCVVEDLLIRLTTQSVFPSQMDCCEPPGPSTSYIAPVHSDPIIPTSRNPHLDVQRFYQDFRLSNYSLDTFLGGFLMLFQVQPLSLAMYKQSFIMPSLG